MIGSLVGAGLSAVGSIFGGISASRAMKRMKRAIEGQKRANQAWYDRRYNEDATQRADAQRILTKTEEMLKNRSRQAAGVQAVTGGSEESVAAAKEAGTQALAEAASQIAANGDARKDQIEAQYQQRDNQLQDQLNNIEANKAQAVTQAIQGVTKTGAQIASAF